MKILIAFLRLIRWPNLLFIALTQTLFFYSVIPFVFRLETENKPLPDNSLFFLIVAASLCIAAAGYIINDYFDLNIDLVNKPDKLVIEKYINRRWAILLHSIFSVTGLGLSLYVGYKLNNYLLPFLNFLSIIALWFYSTTFKKKLLIGNVIISLLTAWVILVLTMIVYKNQPDNNTDITLLTRLLKVSFVYAGFAFIISLVREVVKDMEDIIGDSKYGCKTMPIVWGIPVSKVFSAVWISVLIGALIIIQFYAWQLGWRLSVLYSFLFIILPLGWILKKIIPGTDCQ